MQAYQTLFSHIKAAKKIVLLTHVNPDPDTLGSAMAMYDVLFRMQKKPILYVPTNPIATNLQQMHYADKITYTFPPSYDLAIAFDAAQLHLLGETAQLELDISKLIVIDHHISNSEYGMLNIIDTQCISTTQLLFNLFETLDITIKPPCATALLTGLISDSQSFSTDRMRKEVYEMAATLTEKGADNEAIHRLLYATNGKSTLNLAQMMLDTIQLHFNATVATIEATQTMYEQSGASYLETDLGLQLASSLAVTSLTILLREESGQTKVSLRSKTAQFDVNAIAQHFNGGGHTRAAAFKSMDSKTSVKQALLDYISKEIM